MSFLHNIKDHYLPLETAVKLVTSKLGLQTEQRRFPFKLNLIAY
uniref:Uncharacterized protein n=1 Tax=uncultured alpha proteobacterium HF0070_14E07 TaxID=710804 RepID=E0XS40_9PROT|nr:hypothetical protein [uncultured alpha proteobacterium HF0070_14E07]